MSLNNLANRLSDLGRREAALQAAEEASALPRAGRARPEAFTPDLAMSLNNLATMLSDLGRREAALQAAEEAVDLAASWPGRGPTPSRPIWPCPSTTWPPC